jgi:muconolactone delta-isomerase
MEYLVDMTTHVPVGTSQESIDEIRAREAIRSGELAESGHLLRLWRPPLQPGEWRTLGLFGASDDGELERVLASMPLRVWRTDSVTSLALHPNDPELSGLVAPEAPDNERTAEFLTTFAISAPKEASEQAVDETLAREAARARELADQRHLLRLWTLPAEGRTRTLPAEGRTRTLPAEGRALGLWQAADAAELHQILESLPQFGSMTIEVTPLAPHPNDPASIAGRRHG